MIALSIGDFFGVAAALLTLLLLLDRQSLLREMKRTRREVKALRRALLIQGKPTKREPIPPWLRQKVIERCEYQCQYCGGIGDEVNGPDGLVWHVDHVVPIIKGGPTHEGNLTLSCESCNLAKGKQAAAEFNGKAIDLPARAVSAISEMPSEVLTVIETDDSSSESLEQRLERVPRYMQSADPFDCETLYLLWVELGHNLNAVQRTLWPDNGGDGSKEHGGAHHYWIAAAVNAELRRRGYAPRYKEQE